MAIPYIDKDCPTCRDTGGEAGQAAGAGAVVGGGGLFPDPGEEGPGTFTGAVIGGAQAGSPTRISDCGCEATGTAAVAKRGAPSPLRATWRPAGSTKAATDPVAVAGTLLRNLRARGIVPHPYGQQADELFLQAIGQQGSGGKGGSDAGGPLEPDVVRSLDEAPAQGVNNLHLFVEEEGGRYGTWEEILADMAELRAGYLRHLNSGDLRWKSLFPDTPIPPPAEIKAALEADGYAVLASFTSALIQAVSLGIRLSPTLFTHGGGQSENGASPGVVVPADAVLDVARYRDAVGDGKPDHQSGAILAAETGWDSWYWDWKHTDGPSPAPEDTGAEAARNLYQRFALSLLWRSDGAWDYEIACCRRKRLAVAIFGNTLGTYLATLRDEIRRVGGSLSDALPFIESGNEMDAEWLVREELDTGTGSTPCDLTRLSRGATEFGLFHTLLAAGVQTAWSGARFRLGETLSPHCAATWPYTCDWVGLAGGWGVEHTLGILNRAWEWMHAADTGDTATIQRLVALMPTEDEVSEGFAWMDTCLGAGVPWPPPDTSFDLSPSGLISQVGFHYYRVATVPCEAGGEVTYDDQAVTCEFVQTFIERAAGIIGARLGSTPSMSCGEVGFPAADLGHLVESYAGANPTFQAAMLVRLFLTLRGMGLANVAWHTHISTPLAQSDIDRAANVTCNPTSDQWSLFRTMGLRNDISDGSTFTAREDAYARPSWFALQRPNTMLLRAGAGVTIRLREVGTMVVEVALAEPIEEGEGSWTRAYVIWLDQAADSAVYGVDRTFSFDDAGGRGFSFLSLVPTVSATTGFGSPIVEGYNPSAVPDWVWSGWNQSSSANLGRSFQVTVPRANATSNPAPVCVLTNAELVL